MRFIRRLLFIFLSLVFFLWIGIFIVLQTHQGQQIAIKRFTSFFEESTGTKIKIRGIHFSYPLELSIDRVKILKNDIPVCVAESVHFSLSYSRLLQGKCVFPFFHIKKLELYSLPSSASSSPPVFFHLKFREIRIETLLLHSPLTDHLPADLKEWKDSPLSLKGELSTDPLEGFFSLNDPLTQDFVAIRLEKEVVQINGKKLSFKWNGLETSLKIEAQTDLANWKSINGKISGSLGAHSLPFPLSQENHFHAHFSTNALESLNISSFEWGSSEWKLMGNGTVNSEGIFENVDFKGEFASPLSLNKKITWKGSLTGSFTVPSVLLDITHEEQSMDLKIEKEAPDSLLFSILKSNFYGLSLAGKLHVSIDSLLVEGSLSGITTPSFHFPFENQLIEGETGVKATFYKSNLSSQAASIVVEGKNTKVNGHSLKEVVLSLDLPHLSNISDFPFSLHTQSEAKEFLGWNIKAKGFWKQDEEIWSTEWEEIKGTLGQFPLEIRSPFSIFYEKKEWKIPSLALRWGDIDLTGYFSKKEEMVETSFQADFLSLDVLTPYLNGVKVEGQAHLEGDFKGPLQRLPGAVRARLENIRLDTSLLPASTAIHGNISLEMRPNDLKLQSAIYGIGPQPLMMEGSLPLYFRLPSLELIEIPDQPMDLHLAAEGDIDPYLDLFAPQIAGLDGYIKMDLQAKGTWKEPKIGGTLDLLKGSFESTNTGAIFHEIEAHVEGSTSKLELKKFSAKDDKKGVIQAKGFLELDFQKNFPYEFLITCSKVSLIDADYASLSASGDLQLVGNKDKGKLKGELYVDKASIHLEESLPSSIKTVEVVYVNAPENENKTPHLSATSSEKIDVDVSLKVENTISVEGKSISSTWKGGVVISGHFDQLLFDGDLNIVKGEYNLNGKIFNLSQGNIHFGGPLSKKTTLYIIASKDINNILTEIIVKGPISKPLVSFRSNPPLSQREILSYILFNRGIYDITTDQGAHLSQSFMEFQTSAQASSSNDYLSRLRNNVGIDRLDFGSSNDSDYSLEIGKNITENVAFSVNKSIIDAIYSYAIEAKLRKNLKAEAVVGVGDGYQLRTSIKWKHDY